MNLQILGPRILVRAYTMPEQIGSIIVPEYYRGGYCGTLFEAEQVTRAFSRALTCTGTLESKRLVGVRYVCKQCRKQEDPLCTDCDPPLEIHEDDIIHTKGMFRGLYAGPEIEWAKGYKCWFLEATETVAVTGKEEQRPTIAWIWPASTWRQSTKKEAA